MKQSPRIRRGFTLLEVAIVLAILGVLFAVMTMFISTLMQTQRKTIVRDRQRREFARLDAILRSDVHAAAVAEVKSPGECELKNDQGERWTYRVSEGNLLRERWQGEERQQQEIFQLAPGTEVEFRVAREKTRSLLQLNLDVPTAVDSTDARQAPYRGQMLVGGGLAGSLAMSKEDQP